MIPLKLVLRNFMPYRDNVPPLSFEGIHVACLTGDNGNGKSAIFDAMTWALWGRSRARTDDELIHLGQSDMEVDFEFAVSNQRYRIIRKLSKGAPGRASQSSLNFYISGNGEMRDISGNTQRETQQKIIVTLHMDYETFINSAFILQGHAQEFTNKRAGDRKKVLGDILGLSVYDDLAKLAGEWGRDRVTTAEALVGDLKSLDERLGNRPADEEEFTRVQPELVSIEKQVKEEETALSVLRKANEEYRRKKSQLADLERLIGENNRERDFWQMRVEESVQRIVACQQIIADRESIELGFIRLQEARKANEELGRKLSQLRNIEKSISQLEKAIEQASRALVVNHEVLREQIDRTEARSLKLSQLETELASAQLESAQVSRLEQELETRKSRAQELRGQIPTLEEQVRHFEAESATITEKLALLAGEHARCPLCESVLGAGGVERIQKKLEAEREVDNQSRQKALESNRRCLSELAVLQKDIEKRFPEIEAKKSTLQQRIAALEREKADIRQALKELESQKSSLEEIEIRLAQRDYSPEKQEALIKLELEKQQLSYDEVKHSEIQKLLNDLQHFEGQMQNLNDSVRDLAVYHEAKKAAGEAIEKLANRLRENETKVQSLSNELSSDAELAGKLETSEQKLMALRQQERSLSDNIAALKQRLKEYERIEVERGNKRLAWQHAVDEAAVYKQLGEAFGPRGVQALLIEQAIPDIVNEANRLLARMTDGRMAMTLETQRPKKGVKEGIIETLDIRIADELGTRNYEMFSGGEAYRIDLALRIALSKLLVKRAGAALPTLIIDEGFGTQDSAGREKMVEAINSIQQDFEKIFIITHLEEFKEAFPTRINVTKTLEGSMIEVS